MSVHYIIDADNSFAIYKDGKQYHVNSAHRHYDEIKEVLVEERFDELDTLLDVGATIETYMDGHVKVEGGQVLYDNEPVHNYVVEKILEFREKGFPYKNLVKFLDRLMENPSKKAVDYLYRFLEQHKLPITQEGLCVGYKGVRDDMKDSYSGTVQYEVGKETRLRRNIVDDNERALCGTGYHVGSFEYAKGYGTKLLTVMFDPKDVVSVYTGSEHGDLGYKIRVCALTPTEVNDHDKRYSQDDYAHCGTNCDCDFDTEDNEDFEDEEE